MTGESTRQDARVAILPNSSDELERAVTDAGGTLAEIGGANALVWTQPRDPSGMKATLDGNNVTWVQLPFAGIESFVATGVIDPALTWTCAKGIYGPACAEHTLALMLAASASSCCPRPRQELGT